MTTYVLIGGFFLLFGGVIWLAIWAARRHGRDEQRAKDLEATNEARKRMADADARKPRTPGDVVKRLRKHGL